MPTILPLILVLIAVVNIISKSKKQQEARSAAQRNRPMPPQAQPPVRNVSPAASRPAAPLHESRPLEAHIHTPVMGIEGEGTEGIDCCHEYMLSTPEEEKPAAVSVPQNENINAQTLLQGVIFSEILGRRQVRRYGGRRA